MLIKNKILYILIFILVIFSQNTLLASTDQQKQTIQTPYNLTTLNNEFEVNSLMNAALDNDYKAASIFIKTGVDIDAVNIANCTALHLAARVGAYETTKMLVEVNADIDAIDNEGWTPLMRAALASYPNIVELLIENGAYLWETNDWDETALIHATMSNCLKCAEHIIINTYPEELDNLVFVKTQTIDALDIAVKKYNEELIALLKSFQEELEESLKLKTSAKKEKDFLFNSTPPIKIEDKKEKNLISATIKSLLYVFNGEKKPRSEFDKDRQAILKTIKELNRRSLAKQITFKKQTVRKKITIQKKQEVVVSKKPMVLKKEVLPNDKNKKVLYKLDAKKSEKIEVKPMILKMQKTEPTTKETKPKIVLKKQEKSEKTSQTLGTIQLN